MRSRGALLAIVLASGAPGSALLLTSSCSSFGDGSASPSSDAGSHLDADTHDGSEDAGDDLCVRRYSDASTLVCDRFDGSSVSIANWPTLDLDSDVNAQLVIAQDPVRGGTLLATVGDTAPTNALAPRASIRRAGPIVGRIRLGFDMKVEQTPMVGRHVANLFLHRSGGEETLQLLVLIDGDQLSCEQQAPDGDGGTKDVLVQSQRVDAEWHRYEIEIDARTGANLVAFRFEQSPPVTIAAMVPLSGSQSYESYLGMTYGPSPSAAAARFDNVVLEIE